jgi:hypothetical protein
MPQSQIPDTIIIRGNGRFDRTVKTIARIRFIRMDDQAALFRTFDPLTRDLPVNNHDFRVRQEMMAPVAPMYSRDFRSTFCKTSVML